MEYLSSSGERGGSFSKPFSRERRFPIMAEQNLYCEECVEEIQASEVYLEDDRLYCKQCGSELESPDGDLFEEIESNIDNMHFRDDEEEEESGGDEEADGMSLVKT